MPDYNRANQRYDNHWEIAIHWAVRFNSNGQQNCLGRADNEARSSYHYGRSISKTAEIKMTDKAMIIREILTLRDVGLGYKSIANRLRERRIADLSSFTVRRYLQEAQN